MLKRQYREAREDRGQTEEFLKEHILTNLTNTVINKGKNVAVSRVLCYLWYFSQKVTRYRSLYHVPNDVFFIIFDYMYIPEWRMLC